MRRSSTQWLSFLADLAIRLHPNRPDCIDADERVRRLDHKNSASRLGIRMTEWLRNRLRPNWLRLRSDKQA